MVPVVKRYTKNPVGAHYGVRGWLLQRLTAVVMAGYTLFLIGYLVARAPRDYNSWRVLFSETWFQVGTMLFLAALIYHAWVGMRDILMDYLRATGVRLLAQSAVGFVLVFYLIWSAAILWGR
jgi:succinate dehydrogenase / fumarate reductase membrane anchor subunit